MAGHGEEKVFVFADGDPFQLDGPVKKLQRVLARKGLRADIRILAGASHSVWNNELRKSMHADIDRIVRSAASN